ncbi:MobF family relaxase [Nocardioides sp. GXZ039]|uniref:MobF family relaxase n=1 Tax=Nocardioides sp. GXZ039 TaxID=3136018 RepID=UPI0030F3B80C
MSLHKLSAGDGYQYLIRQTAAADRELEPREALSDYYSEKGEQPGVWAGSGLAGLASALPDPDKVDEAVRETVLHLRSLAAVALGSTVTAEQMAALFGEGRQPNADALEAAMAAAGGSPKEQQRASKLGNKFRRTASEPHQFVVECAREYEAYNVAIGNPRTAPVPEKERALIRTRIGKTLFTEYHGRPPADSRELSGFIARESRPREQACAGFDLTFSPVKSVSALWAVADRDTSRTIEQAHEAAVRDTLDWLEREIIYTRRGANGARTVSTAGLLATMFVHRDSRAGDPDLHTHVAIANKVQDPEDGAWLAIDAQVLYKHTVAASERYNTRLEAELSERLGVTWEPVTTARNARPVREIVGVASDLLRRWSTRRSAIDARLTTLTAEFQERHGRVPTPKEALDLAQQANLETREAKHEHRSHADQREQWAAEAARALGGPDAVDEMVQDALHQVATPRAELSPERIADLAEQALATTEAARATFQYAHIRAEAERLVRSAEVPRATVDDAVEAVTSAVLSGVDTVAIGSPDSVHEPVAMLRADGSSQYATPRSQLYTTTRVQSAERFLVDAAQERGARRVSEVDVSVALLTETANAHDLNEGQQQLVRAMATSGARLQLALAPAGTGKTTAMRALATAWTGSGGNVLSLAPSAVAARELAEATGAASSTLDKLVWDIEHDEVRASSSPFAGVDDKTLIIIDEAGMASTPALATAVAFARERGASVRLIGDTQQLAAIGAGGVLRDIESTVGADSLYEVIRFACPAEATASLALRDGRAVEAIGFYLDQSRVRAASPINAVDDIFNAWSQARATGDNALMVAADKDSVNELNARARLARLAGDKVSRSVALRSGLEASAGDTIVTRRNNRSLRVSATDHVKNGDRWTVQRVHRDGAVTVVHDVLRRRIRLPADYVADHVDLGYAATVHGSQGQTVDRCFALVTGAWDRAAAYVAMTRGRLENSVYVVTGGDGDPHTQITPDQVEQPTATDTLLQVFGRDSSATSAHSAAEDAVSPVVELARFARIYGDGLGRAAILMVGQDRYEEIARDTQVLAPGISDTPSWDRLVQHLCVLELRGEDAIGTFATALASRPLVDDLTDPSRDDAAVMLWRLDDTDASGAGPLPWLPPIPDPILTHPEYGPWLEARSKQLSAAASEVRTLADTWTVETAPAWAQRLLGLDGRLVGDLAVWRAARHVRDDDLRPVGREPSDRRERRHYKGLVERLKRHRATLTGPTHHWAGVLNSHPALTADPWWPVLADRLDELTTGGLDLTNADVLRALEQVAAEHANAALREPTGDDPVDAAPDRVDAPTEPPASESTANGSEKAQPVEASVVDAERRARVVELHRAAHEFYAGHAAGSWIGGYLRGRGLAGIIDKAGYAPRGPRALVEHLTQLGHSVEDLVQAGLAVDRDGKVRDTFRDRVVLTVYATGADGSPEPVAFVGRAPQGHPDYVPKYLNTPGTAAFVKGEVLYGLAEHVDALRAGAIPVLVESQVCAEAVTLATGGTHIGLSSGGTSLTADQVAALGTVVDLASTPIVVATDEDVAGRKAAVNAWRLLVDAGVEDPRSVRLTRKDPAEVLEQDGAETLATTLAETSPLIGTVVNAHLDKWGSVLDHIDGQLGALRAIARDAARAAEDQQIYATVLTQVAVPLDSEVVSAAFDEARGVAHAPLSSDFGSDAAEAPIEAEVGDREDSDLLRDDLLVEALLHAALDRPLPDEHQAAALWSRLSPLTTGNHQADSPTHQLLATDLDLKDAAKIMATPAWPAIAAQVRADVRAGRRSTLTTTAIEVADSGQTFESSAAFSAAVLERLQAPDSAESPDRARLDDLLARVRATRAETQERLREQTQRRDDHDRPAPRHTGPTPTA